MAASLLAAEIRRLEAARAESPDDAALTRPLAEAYAKAGVFQEKTIPVYEAAARQALPEPSAHRALSIACLLRSILQVVNEQTEYDRLGIPLRPADVKTLDDKIEIIASWAAQYPQSADLFKTLADLQFLRGRFSAAADSCQRAMDQGFRPLLRLLDILQQSDRAALIAGRPAVFYARLALECGRDALAETLLEAAIACPFDPDPETRNFSATPQDEKEAMHACALEATDMLCDLLLRRRNRLKDSEQRDIITLRIARLRFDRGDLPAAAACVEEIGERAALESDFVKTLARRLSDAGDYRMAFNLLRALPPDPEVKGLLGVIGLSLDRAGEHDTATYIRQFIREHDFAQREARLTQEQDREMETQLAMGDMQREEGRWTRALARYAAALRAGRANPAPIIQRIEEALAQKPPDLTASLLTELGGLFAARNNPARAIELFEQALQIDGSHKDARAGLRRLYEQTLTDNPNQPDLRLRSGDLYLLTGDVSKAIAEYKSAARFPPCEGQALQRLASAYARSRNLTLALECYCAMEPAQPDLDGLERLLNDLTQANLYREALRAAQLIARYRPDYKDISKTIALLQAKLESGGGSSPDDPHMRKLIGDQAIGRYTYIERIGSGGMGTVHKIRDVKNGQVRALKILREGLIHNTKAIERFFREARVAATLNHPNIVLIYDYNLNPLSGRSYIVMEYVDGPSLRARIEDRLDSDFPLPWEDIREDLLYIRQLCDALAATHAKNIIHRDIKPDNILVNSKGQVKITDFGIMHMEEATFTPTGALVGTPRYMSPEQVQGGRIDARSDLYSTGIVLFELLTGSPPFATGDVAYQQINAPPVAPSDLQPQIPQDVNRLIMRLLEKKPENRPASAQELKKEVDAILAKLWPGVT
ncbi:MAG: protein kinase [Candidatus Sumerlaeota bacterium]|nr:protein kinase [Candidatus Sumerlaeota bacterium]